MDPAHDDPGGLSHQPAATTPDDVALPQSTRTVSAATAGPVLTMPPQPVAVGIEPLPGRPLPAPSAPTLSAPTAIGTTDAPPAVPRRRWPRVLAVAGVVVVVSALAVLYARQRDTTAELRGDLGDANEEIAQLVADLAAVSDALEAAEADVARTREELAAASARADEAEAEHDAARAELTDLEEAVRGLYVAALMEYDPSVTVEQAECVVDSVVESLGLTEMLRLEKETIGSDDDLPPELERAATLAFLEC